MILKDLTRRRFLAGTTKMGVQLTVALPLLDILLNNDGDALANGANLPYNFILWFWGNGIIPEDFFPQQAGAQFQLSPNLMPFAANQEYLTVLSGINGRSGNGTHESGIYAALSGSEFSGRSPHPNNTIDQAIADHIGGNSLQKSIQLGVSQQHYFENIQIFNNISYRNQAPIQPIFDQQQVFANLFQGINKTEEEKKALIVQSELSLGVIDAVKEDAKQLKKILGMSDQKRVDAHLENIFEIESKLKKQANGEFGECEIDPQMDLTGETLKGKNDIMAKLATLALSCGTSKVISFQFSGGATNTVFPGIAGDHHSTTHNPNAQGTVSQMTTAVMEHLNTLATELRSQAMGDGNLLDSTCIYATSEMSHALRHSTRDFPILLIGKAGNKLKGNFHYQGQNQSTDNVLATIAKLFEMESSQLNLRDTQSIDDVLV
ncbi:DUF1552 domain-containing protein [Pseudobacteriovorax antillogorgiicola]|uniref:Tat (Twin-arginine translocation) pathway signal sequence n=1 Tax=Pseudobacteriovorax antillogorgiicola TaxID=1513793 RepID=A0A1Y6BEP4_9BACT|nr:DUF1552 domain-containing protein [Pseudobacteriovorax antillogorgiicola]TCS58553.1 uncharacterized protein DUF1552 [Pseudobacteriovorax antillogorgiicola]SME97662.1 Protein of unknown function [Pseudobacteriovorax antillogorgiicola]